MNKSQIINKMISVIKDYAEKYNLEISDKGFEDSHCIPNVIAERNTMSEEENIYIDLWEIGDYLIDTEKPSFSEPGGKTILIILLKDGTQYAGFVTLPMPE